MARVVNMVVLDEQERWTLRRTVSLLPLAYPVAGEHPGLDRARESASGSRLVDERDPRLRVLGSLSDEPVPVSRERLALAHEVARRLVEVTAEQSDPAWWRHLTGDRHLRAEDEQMAEAMAAERAGQHSKAVAALQVIAGALDLLTAAD